MPDANRGIPYEASPSKRSKKALIQRVLQEAGIGVALLLLIVVFSVAAPHFTDESNITDILTQITINLIMATGMTFVILIGGIDLSVGSVMARALQTTSWTSFKRTSQRCSPTRSTSIPRGRAPPSSA